MPRPSIVRHTACDLERARASPCANRMAAVCVGACRWVASSDNTHHNGGFCNYDWPAAEMPAQAKPIVPDPEAGLAVSVDALAWVYVWPEADAL